MSPQGTHLCARQWIATNTHASLEITNLGPFETPEGLVAFCDPLVLMADFAQHSASCPRSGGEIVVFHDTKECRNSKLASIFTPGTHTATQAFYKALGPKRDPYAVHFSRYDEPCGGERKIVPLPNGTPEPYIHSGWGDGAYPVFSLTDSAGRICALYTDFPGRDEEGRWLTPPDGPHG